jgi:hypothetical protein
MLNQSSIDDLINFIKLNNHNLWRKTGDGYYQVYCHYCNDHGRKSGTDHGHGNVGIKKLFYSCWRCDISKPLLQYVLDQGYNNKDVINELKALKQSGYVYGNTKSNTRYSQDNSLYDKLNFNYITFKKLYPEFYNQYLQYIQTRCGDINPLKYGFSPLVKNDKLLLEMFNSSGYPITARFISDSDMRYIKYKNAGYYYFQDIRSIIEYKSIVIGEGIFDIVNLSNYCNSFNSSFFFAMNNRKYTAILKYLLSKYLTIGKYNINIIFDQDVYNIDKTKTDLLNIKNQLNPECNLNFYIPTHQAKDVSELMNIKRI